MGELPQKALPTVPRGTEPKRDQIPTSRFYSILLPSEASSYRPDDLSTQRKDAQGRQRPAIDDRIAVDQHFELSVAATNHLHIDSQLTPNPRRHPDGM